MMKLTRELTDIERASFFSVRHTYSSSGQVQQCKCLFEVVASLIAVRVSRQSVVFEGGSTSVFLVQPLFYGPNYDYL